ncbi:hypothetical protein MUY27_03000 [Mucilaginibacter sp. RS28]|uniref:Uncharacterized protein n=1 Tax=Mucilaginibacter straminoryzae TaxID=2932774 RepID=A0A9X1X007_9SPHI|nr:hypothetical protein [Mucilaginibacter straminoryzae]MCJ8208659.1 hypothetical protein [Mucilaginibacter straminoryzae]
MRAKRQYLLKPGKHQFVPRSPAIHHNGNLTDEAAAWYLQRFPHIKALFKRLPKQ